MFRTSREYCERKQDPRKVLRPDFFEPKSTENEGSEYKTNIVAKFLKEQ